MRSVAGFGVGIGVERWIGGGMDDVINSELKHAKD